MRVKSQESGERSKLSQDDNEEYNIRYCGEINTLTHDKNHLHKMVGGEEYSGLVVYVL